MYRYISKYVRRCTCVLVPTILERIKWTKLSACVGDVSVCIPDAQLCADWLSNEQLCQTAFGHGWLSLLRERNTLGS